MSKSLGNGIDPMDMIEKYGTDYEQKLGNKYIYLNGNVELSFIIESDIITAIEYTLVTE